jgi:hypothetical protein
MDHPGHHSINWSSWPSQHQLIILATTASIDLDHPGHHGITGLRGHTFFVSPAGYLLAGKHYFPKIAFKGHSQKVFEIIPLNHRLGLN